MVFTKTISQKLVLTALVIANIACDQLSKQVVRNRIGYLEKITVIESFFTLTRIENKGAFLSFGDTLPETLKLVLLNLLPIVALLYGLYMLYKKSKFPFCTLVGIAFIVGGGIGNLYDRMLYGSVTDFMHLNFVIFETGIFNSADVSIMIGMFLLLFRTYTKRS